LKKTLFKRGFGAVREENKRREVAQEALKGRLWRYWLGEDEEGLVRFLTEEPITFWEHNLPKSGGKGTIPATCVAEMGEECQHCESDDARIRQRTYKAAWLIWDYREFKIKGKDGKPDKKVKGSIKLLVRGVTDATKIDKCASRYGLLNRDYLVTHIGKGNKSTYDFDRQDEKTLTKKEKEAMFAALPEKLKGLDPYEIVEAQIQPLEIKVEEEDNEEEKEKVVNKVKKGVQSVGNKSKPSKVIPVKSVKTVKKAKK
jgi:hypothetical protein